MIRFLSLSLAGCAGALAIVSLARAESPSAYDQFDASAAQTPAERLVLCDTTAFLAGRPDLDANRIVVRRIDRIPVTLLPPQFVSGGFLYSERYDRLFNKLAALHKASTREVATIQAGVGRAMVELYRQNGSVDRPFVARQDKYCRDFAAGYGVRGGF
jgi:hypothetical protein